MSSYDPIVDAWASTEEAYRIIRERAARGGHWWFPKDTGFSSASNVSGVCRRSGEQSPAATQFSETERSV